MIIKVTPDKEKVKSILQLTKERENFVSTIDHEKFSTNAAENYYEIIKELASALLLLDGLKTVGENAHRDLIDYLINYKDFSERDIVFLNDLRISGHFLPRAAGIAYEVDQTRVDISPPASRPPSLS